MTVGGTASLVFTGPHRWSTFAPFNSNAFPPDLGSIVSSCGVRLALLSVARTTLISEIRRAREILLQDLRRYAEGLPASLEYKPTLAYVGYSDGTEYIGALYSALHSARSFLDVYAMLIGKLIDRRVTWSFKRGKIGDIEMPGGKIINWLQSSAPASLLYAERLRDVVLRHSGDWIVHLTDYRDTVVHYSEIQGLRHMSVPLLPMKPGFYEDAIVDPEMPNGMPLPNYIEFLMAKIRQFVVETIPLVPSVDMELCHPERLFEHN